MDTLADALASLEYYLEALREQRPNRDSILDVARQSLEALRYWPLPDVDAAAPMAPSPPIDARRAPRRPDFERRRRPRCRHDGRSSRVRADAGAPTASPPSTGRAGRRAPTPAPAPRRDHRRRRAAGGFEAPATRSTTRSAKSSSRNSRKRSATSSELLPPWRDAPDDSETLRPIRRVFHTLKGSGRLVGAKTLGEFSWKIENMLNRVLDGTRPASPAVIGDGRPRLLQRCRSCTPRCAARARARRPGGHAGASPTASPRARKCSTMPRHAAPRSNRR